MKPKFKRTNDGIVIIDPIERHRYRLITQTTVSPTPVRTARLEYPVDAAVEISTNTITLPTNKHVYIRDESGAMVAEAKPPNPTSMPAGQYTLELSASLKIYLEATGSAYVYFDADQTHIAFGDETRVVVGARSYHTRPAQQITTTTAPTDVMTAVSAFGSALKTLEADRSYPTLRGHPPSLKIGDEVAIPDSLDTPDTGVEITIQPTHRQLFPVVSLAYYLGASVVPGPSPQLTTDRGFEYPLDTGESFERTVGRVLKHVFFLDCIVRTAGITPLPLAERPAVESHLPFDIDALYDEPLAVQLERYLEVPHSVIADHIPEWRLEVHCRPTPDRAPFLPFIANDLAIVQTTDSNTTHQSTSTQQRRAVADFTRSGTTENRHERSGNESSSESIPTTGKTVQQVWQRASESTLRSTTPLSAFYNNVDRRPGADPIEIDVVCTDERMSDELETVNGVYGTHEELPFDVTVSYDVTVAELEEILSSNGDFFHYIGHIDTGGFQCTDGVLSAETVDEVGVKAFILNACQSHEQGIHLIESGSVGGITTRGDVVNNGAINVGGVVARLLNHGFSLYAALNLARKESTVAGQYQIVGDGTTTIAQPTTGVPALCVFHDGITDPVSADEFTVSLETYEGAGTKKGSVVTSHLEPITSYYLHPKRIESVSATPQQLEDFLRLKETPLLVDDEIRWSDDVTERL
ncbi:hypothetical protein [Natronorubrum daqingense]|uniref:Uncharacterized protein n=1 Tax=Natronorubrum daqingense TaxID=588898 RepID=A0A1N7FPT4_9EURY|nr:hypothetical protein [Natronorubrum daqingense]APX97309.1 hypothetical protein BB347_12190 [Natronorubrum daqingense]SIS02275.1 hypothetical protein SAMN05421809_3375 [Natronorubrum daqingense]